MAITKINNKQELSEFFAKINGKISDKMLFDYNRRFEKGYQLEIDAETLKGKWRTPIKRS